MQKIDFIIKKIGYDIKRIGIIGTVKHILSNKGILKMDYYTYMVKHYYENLPQEKYMEELGEWYYVYSGRTIENIEHPETFNDKIQWLKLHDTTELKTMCADKYLVRDYVKNKVGERYLIPLLGVWNNFDEIDFDNLPDSFVLKANNGSGMNLVIKNKASLDKNYVKKVTENWLSKPFGYFGLELHYVKISRKLIAEKYIEEIDGDLHDYKIHCFNGRPMYIQVIGDRNAESHTAYEMFYDIEWNRTNITRSYYPYEKDIQKPQKLNEMLEIAEKLSSPFLYVRVDVYVIGNNIYFGEMTFTSANGSVPFKPAETDKMLGDLIQLPEF